MMEEYALRFYAMLEQSVRIDATDFKNFAFIAAFPHLTDDARDDLLSAYDQMGYDILERLREGATYTPDKELKELFK